MKCLLTFIYALYDQVMKYSSQHYSLQQSLKEKDKWVLHTKYKFFNSFRCPLTHASLESRRQEVIRNILICVTRRYFSLILILYTHDRAEVNQFRVYDPGISFLPVQCILQFSVWGGEKATIQTSNADNQLMQTVTLSAVFTVSISFKHFHSELSFQLHSKFPMHLIL
ncbi:hypothetical protein KP509_1Z055400 [Ceratopteris richardii]|nr:hypothetical protein KP509_1Z055400 [Ceratopteris richardii]